MIGKESRQARIKESGAGENSAHRWKDFLKNSADNKRKNSVKRNYFQQRWEVRSAVFDFKIYFNRYWLSKKPQLKIHIIVFFNNFRMNLKGHNLYDN